MVAHLVRHRQHRQVQRDANGDQRAPEPEEETTAIRAIRMPCHGDRLPQVGRIGKRFMLTRPKGRASGGPRAGVAQW